jgi:hypothetical protein
MFGKDAKVCTTRCDLAGHQLIFLTSEFWHCRTNNLFIQRIRLLKPWCFPLNDRESFAGIARYENVSFMLDPARINHQFATGSGGNLLRVIAHSQGS